MSYFPWLWSKSFDLIRSTPRLSVHERRKQRLAAASAQSPVLSTHVNLPSSAECHSNLSTYVRSSFSPDVAYLSVQIDQSITGCLRLPFTDGSIRRWSKRSSSHEQLSTFDLHSKCSLPKQSVALEKRPSNTTDRDSQTVSASEVDSHKVCHINKAIDTRPLRFVLFSVSLTHPKQRSDHWRKRIAVWWHLRPISSHPAMSCFERAHRTCRMFSMIVSLLDWGVLGWSRWKRRVPIDRIRIRENIQSILWPLVDKRDFRKCLEQRGTTDRYSFSSANV